MDCIDLLALADLDLADLGLGDELVVLEYEFIQQLTALHTDVIEDLHVPLFYLVVVVVQNGIHFLPHLGLLLQFGQYSMIYGVHALMIELHDSLARLHRSVLLILGA